MDTHELGAADTVGPGEGYLLESPLWDHRRGVVLWVDIEAGHVHELDPATDAHRLHQLGGPVSCVALRASGGYVVAKAQSILTVDERFGSPEVVADDLSLERDVRFNDGAVAPDGSFWIGTLSHLRSGGGALLRVGADRRVQTLLDRVSISNGIDWATDPSRPFYVDSGTHTVEILQTAARPDGSLAVESRTDFVAVDRPQTPDGLTVDTEGHVWVACWGGSRVIRVSPAGEVVAQVLLPAPHVSSVAFGGPDLRDLYITTAREELDAAQIAAQPLSGSLFRWRAPVAGSLSRAWAG